MGTMLKARDVIKKMIDSVDTDEPTKYRAMTYEQGVVEALSWVIGEVEDEEFQP